MKGRAGHGCPPRFDPHGRVAPQHDLGRTLACRGEAPSQRERPELPGRGSSDDENATTDALGPARSAVASNHPDTARHPYVSSLSLSVTRRVTIGRGVRDQMAISAPAITSMVDGTRALRGTPELIVSLRASSPPRSRPKIGLLRHRRPPGGRPSTTAGGRGVPPADRRLPRRVALPGRRPGSRPAVERPRGPRGGRRGSRSSTG